MPRVKDVVETGEYDPADGHWHITRGIPIAMIVTMIATLLVQTATAAWFVSRLDSRVDTLEKAQVMVAPQGERLTRVEEKLENVKMGITDIKAILAAQDSRMNNRR